jgi:hypothetical protein
MLRSRLSGPFMASPPGRRISLHSAHSLLYLAPTKLSTEWNLNFIHLNLCCLYFYTLFMPCQNFHMDIKSFLNIHLCIRPIPQLHIHTGHDLTCYYFTYKYDRDWLHTVYTQSVPVIFERPCTLDYKSEGKKRICDFLPPLVELLTLVHSYYMAVRPRTSTLAVTPLYIDAEVHSVHTLNEYKMAALTCVWEKSVHASANSDEAVYCCGHVQQVM